MATVNPGDEVIVFEPAYDAYGPDVAMAGGVVRAVPLAPPDWRFDPERLAAAFGPRTRALILNTPHNPTGQGVLARRAGDDRGAVPPPRRAGHQRRGLRRDPVRRRRARPDRDAARDVRTHDHDRQHGQDVQRHRLEGRLGDRARRADGGGARGAPVRHVHQFGAIPGGARGRAAGRGRRTATTRSCAPTTRAAAICSRACCAARAWSRCRSAARTSC